MGFIEETGAAQHCATRASRRSTKARPASRPTTSSAARRRATAARSRKAVAGEIDKVAARLAARTEPALQAIGAQLAAATADVQAAIDWMVPAYGAAPARRARGRGALPQAVGPRRRRLADGTRGAGRRRPPRGGHGRRAVPARQDRDGALLRRSRCCRRRRRSRTRSCTAARARSRCAAEDVLASVGIRERARRARVPRSHETSGIA